MTPYARRLRDRVRKDLWTGRHPYLDIDVRREDAICYCYSSRLGYKRVHLFGPKRRCPCAGILKPSLDRSQP